MLLTADHGNDCSSQKGNFGANDVKSFVWVYKRIEGFWQQGENFETEFRDFSNIVLFGYLLFSTLICVFS